MVLDIIPGTEYNFSPVWAIVSTNARRAHLRVARSARGSEKKKGTEKEQREKKRKHSDVIYIDVRHSDASSSSCSCDLVSSFESNSDNDNWTDMLVVHFYEKLGLLYCMSQLGAWVGEWVGGSQIPPPGVGGYLSVCGYAEIQGGWVPELTPRAG